MLITWFGSLRQDITYMHCGLFFIRRVVTVLVSYQNVISSDLILGADQKCQCHTGYINKSQVQTLLGDKREK